MFIRRLIGREDKVVSKGNRGGLITSLLLALAMLLPGAASAVVNPCSGNDWNLQVSFFVGQANGSDIATMQFRSAAKPNCEFLNKQVVLTLPTPEELEVQPEPSEQWYLDTFEDAVSPLLPLNAINFNSIGIDYGTVNIDVTDDDAAEISAAQIFQDMVVEYYEQFYPGFGDYIVNNHHKSCATPLIGQDFEHSREHQLGWLTKAAKGVVVGTRGTVKLAKRAWRWAKSPAGKKIIKKLIASDLPIDMFR